MVLTDVQSEYVTNIVTLSLPLKFKGYRLAASDCYGVHLYVRTLSESMEKFGNSLSSASPIGHVNVNSGNSGVSCMSFFFPCSSTAHLFWLAS